MDIANSALAVSDEVDSIFGPVLSASASNKEFAFDDVVIDSQVYRRVLSAATQGLRDNQQTHKTCEDDLLDLGLMLVDVGESIKEELVPEYKPSHGLEELIIPDAHTGLDAAPTQPSVPVGNVLGSQQEEESDHIHGLIEHSTTEEVNVTELSGEKGKPSSAGMASKDDPNLSGSMTHSRVLPDASALDSKSLEPEQPQRRKSVKKMKPRHSAEDACHKDTRGAESIRSTRPTFPKAFERWEALSSHWEGMTSYWVRRMEANAADINSDPVAQQLSRQITDLSSAGANLFHAVVELQRLHLSSERKFQKSFDEIRKEWAISKDEARRAWEELGRREEQERDRYAAMMKGQDIIVYGRKIHNYQIL